MTATRISCAALLSTATLLVSGRADATFPGGNGVLAFSRLGSGNIGAWVASASFEEHAEVTLLTGGPLPVNALPAWSADGTCLAFYSTRYGGGQEVYAMHADGSNQTRLTVNPWSDDYSPAWSPDGRHLAFSSMRAGPHQLFVLDLETGVTKQITTLPGFDFTPEWSPDGTTIAFVSARDGNYEIYTVASDGQQLQRLTDNPGHDAFADWSPDGLKLAFGTQREGTKGLDIWIMDADGSNPAPLVTLDGDQTGPAFSPDGKYLAFTGTDESGFDHIYVVNASDGSGLVQVTDGVANDRWPDWQPLTEAVGTGLCPTITPKICGDANVDGRISTSDALRVLRKSSKLPVDCARIRCDTDADGTVLASDSLRLLRAAVGEQVQLVCPDVEPWPYWE